MAMAADAVSSHPLLHLGEQQVFARRAAGAGHARFGVDDDLVRVDRTGLQQRDERKLGAARIAARIGHPPARSEEHTSELQSLMRNSYADFCLEQKKIKCI